MKKLSALLLVAAMIFAVTACSVTSDSTSGSTVSDEETPTTSTEDTSSKEEISMKRVKLLMMGDSTTNGDGNEAAFRFTMYQELLEAGCFFESIGNRTSGDYRLTNAYKKHFAQGGRRTDELTEVYKNMVADGKMDYDIAVITIGLNDIFQGGSISTLYARYVELLDTVFADRPDAKVFFAELIRMPNVSNETYNIIDQSIAKLVTEYKGKGYDITLLEHDLISEYDFTNPDHYITFGPNLQHPNHIGNAEIGKGYAAAIKDAILEMNKLPADEQQTKAIPAKEISLSETEVSLKIGEQIKVRYIVSPANSDVASAVLTSSDDSVATVNAYGVITAHKAGTATITARVTGTDIETTCEVVVSDEKLVIAPAGSKILLSDDFSTAKDWGTGANYITAGELRLPWSQGLYAATKESYTVSKDAGSISFKCLILEQIGNTSGVLSVKLGDYELQLVANQATVNLLYNGDVIGSYKNTPQFYPADDFVINFVDGKVTVYRNHEILITADAHADAEGKLEFNFPSYGTLAIDDLVIRSGK